MGMHIPPGVFGMAAGAVATTAILMHADATRPDGWVKKTASNSEMLTQFSPIIGGTALGLGGLLGASAARTPAVRSALQGAGEFGVGSAFGAVVAGTIAMNFMH